MNFHNSRYFIINKKMMVFSGLWPFQNLVMKYITRGIFTVLMLTSSMPHLISVYKYSNVDIDKVIQSSAITFYVLGVAFKFFTIVAAETKITKVYDNVERNWHMIDNEDEMNILRQHSEFGRLLTVGYVSYMFSALLFFITMPAIPTLLDAISPLNESRPKIFTLDGEFIVDKYEHYGKVYLFESFTCVITVYIFSTVDSTYAVCVQQCIGLIAVVRQRLKVATKYGKQVQLSDNEDKDLAYDSVAQSIALHQKCVDFANVLESAYSMSFFVSMAFNMMILSVGSVIILMNMHRPMEFFRFTMIFIGLLIHMFYLSWPGQKLMDISSEILYDAFNTEWYECSLKTQKLLKFLMLRCVEPCQLTAGGIYVMNIPNCGSLAKTSLSYITVFASFR